MLKTLVPRLICPTCSNGLHLEIFTEGDHDHVANGVLICQCGCWYPIDRDVLELVPPALLDHAEFAAFRERFAAELRALELHENFVKINADYSAQIKQREHFDLYALNKPEFPDYTRVPFIRASSTRYIKLWRRHLTKPDAWICDIGCGTGIHSYPLMDRGTLIGFDISPGATRLAVEGARERGLMDRCSFFVGDGSALPFVSESFDYAHTFGVLHHVPSPRDTLIETYRILKPGGIHFAVENNKSAFRPIFDWMMKLDPLWIEEAGAHPTMSRLMIDDWVKNLPVTVDSETSIFIPPHVFNLMGRYAVPFLDWTDRVFSYIPWWDKQGGQLVCTITKAM